jgi:hypothetical protein
VRVPAVAINPFIKNKVESNIFEHCSIPSTLSKIFDLDYLNERVFNSNTFESIINLDNPRKLKDMPNPEDLQKELDDLKKLKFMNDDIDYETFKNFTDKPLGKKYK